MFHLPIFLTPQKTCSASKMFKNLIGYYHYRIGYMNITGVIIST